MTVSRRAFLHTAAATAAFSAIPGRTAGGAAADPVKRTGGPSMKLSLAAYSFRDSLAGAKKSMTLDDFVDLASTYDLEAVEPTSYYFPDPPTPAYCRTLRRHAFLQGLAISGTAVRNTFTHRPGPELDKEIDHVKRWVDLAAELHAPSIRIFAGDLQKGTSEADARRWSVDAIHRACEHAGSRGVILALENHGGIVTTAEQLLAIVREVKSDWFGVNLDTGNFRGADPYAELAQAVALRGRRAGENRSLREQRAEAAGRLRTDHLHPSRRQLSRVCHSGVRGGGRSATGGTGAPEAAAQAHRSERVVTAR